MAGSPPTSRWTPTAWSRGATVFSILCGRDIREAATEFLRTFLPRTRANRGKDRAVGTGAREGGGHAPCSLRTRSRPPPSVPVAPFGPSSAPSRPLMAVLRLGLEFRDPLRYRV